MESQTVAVAALADMSPEHRERLRAAVRLMIKHLLDSASLNRENGIQTDNEPVQATASDAVQLGLEL